MCALSSQVSNTSDEGGRHQAAKLANDVPGVVAALQRDSKGCVLQLVVSDALCTAAASAVVLPERSCDRTKLLQSMSHNWHCVPLHPSMGTQFWC
jgi:hypothetical protein